MNAGPADPRISFVLPTRNSMPYVHRALEGLLAQGYDAYELIVQDGGSTDGTLEYFDRVASESFGDHLRLQTAPDTGIGQAYNRGLQRADGDLVWFLASDEVLRPHAVEAALRWYRRHPDAATIYSGVDLVDEYGTLLKTFTPPPFDLVRFMQCAVFPTPSGILNRRVIGDDLYYDETLKTCPDYDFWIRLGSRFSGDQIIEVPEVWTSALGTIASTSFRVEAFDQFCRDKLAVLDRFLNVEPGHAVLPALRNACAAGIYCWAAESVYALCGATRQVVRYLAEAARLDRGSPRVTELARHSVSADVDPYSGELALEHPTQTTRPIQGQEQLTLESLSVKDFETFPYWQGARVNIGQNGAQIFTPQERWAYAAILPLNLPPPDPTVWTWLLIRARVLLGIPSLSLIVRDEANNDRLVDERFLAMGEHEVYVRYMPENGRVAGLLVRNVSSDGASMVEVRDVMLVQASREAETDAVREMMRREPSLRSYVVAARVGVGTQ